MNVCDYVGSDSFTTALVSFPIGPPATRTKQQHAACPQPPRTHLSVEEDGGPHFGSHLVVDDGAHGLSGTEAADARGVDGHAGGAGDLLVCWWVGWLGGVGLETGWECGCGVVEEGGGRDGLD